MRIYFGGAIAGGRGDQAIYQHIVERLKALGHTVPTEHVAHPDVLEEERSLPPRAVYERDMVWLEESDAMIAEVSTPSLGVGYEISTGLQRGLPILCLCREGLHISALITGNSTPGLAVALYRTPEELDRHIDRFLSALNATGVKP
jgi:hypothetical protein